MTDQTNELVGSALRSRREAMGVSQTGLARALDLSRASVCNIELGRQAMSIEHLYLAAEALGTTARELLPERGGSVAKGRQSPDVDRLLELLDGASA